MSGSISRQASLSSTHRGQDAMSSVGETLGFHTTSQSVSSHRSRKSLRSSRSTDHRRVQSIHTSRSHSSRAVAANPTAYYRHRGHNSSSSVRSGGSRTQITFDDTTSRSRVTQSKAKEKGGKKK